MGGFSWRGETFDRLKLASSETRWPGYARFAGLQEKGLRAEALREITAFAESLRQEPLQARWDFVSWLLAEVLGPGRNHSARGPVPTPLGGCRTHSAGVA
ncbi:MAG: hypothetical protein U0904_01435 [Candidatus Nanopelagicales bacterium]|nr:hypothetical protein [Candidatus Nanopelagicales bacterium]